MTRAEALEHVKNNLNLVQELSKTAQMGRCYYGGTLVYVRKDSGPMTQTDLDALKLNGFGQVNRVLSQPGDSQARVEFEVDSSD